MMFKKVKDGFLWGWVGMMSFPTVKSNARTSGNSFLAILFVDYNCGPFLFQLNFCIFI